jgi:hypothetical protein
MEVQLGAETQLGPSICVILTVYILPTPPYLSTDTRGELYTCAQCCCRTVL